MPESVFAALSTIKSVDAKSTQAVPARVLHRPFGQCLADPGSLACYCCRDTNCNAAFVTCSGLPKESAPDGGSCP